MDPAVDAVYRAAWHGRRADPAAPATVELVDLGVAEPYYRPAVGYMGVAGRRRLGPHRARRQLRTALELGPHLRSLIVGADVMDIVRNDAARAEGRQIVARRDEGARGRSTDKAYDLFVALQVFEHLGTRQPEAFLEVRRVARNAILSLPIDWVMADPRNCHHLVTEERVLGWFAPVVPTKVVVGNPGHRKRLIYVFEDLPAPDAEPATGPSPTRRRLRAGRRPPPDPPAPASARPRAGSPAAGAPRARSPVWAMTTPIRISAAPTSWIGREDLVEEDPGERHDDQRLDRADERGLGRPDPARPGVERLDREERAQEPDRDEVRPGVGRDPVRGERPARQDRGTDEDHGRRADHQGRGRAAAVSAWPVVSVSWARRSVRSPASRADRMIQPA